MAGEERVNFRAQDTAVLAIDLHTGYLDAELSNSPLDAKVSSVILENCRQLFNFARGRGMPVIHAILKDSHLRGRVPFEDRNPFYQRKIKSGKKESARLKDLPGPRFNLPAPLAPLPGDYVIDTKSSMSSFWATDLDRCLIVNQIKNLIISGINTNTCVQCAAFDAFNRYINVIVVEDCVTSNYGEDLHRFALENIRRCLGLVVKFSELPSLFV